MKSALYLGALVVLIAAVVTIGAFYVNNSSTSNTLTSTSPTTSTVTNTPGTGPQTPGACGSSKTVSANGLSLRVSESASTVIGSRVCIDLILTNNRNVDDVPSPIYYNVTDGNGNVLYGNICQTYPPVGQPNTLAPSKYIECTDFWNTQQVGNSTSLASGVYHLSVSYNDSATNTSLNSTADFQLNST